MSRQLAGAQMKAFLRFAIFGAIAPAVSTLTMFVLAGWAVFLRTHSADAALAWLADSTQSLESRLSILVLVVCAIPALGAAALSRLMWSERPTWLRVVCGFGALATVAPLTAYAALSTRTLVMSAAAVASSLMALALCDRISRWVERRPSREVIADTFA